MALDIGIINLGVVEASVRIDWNPETLRPVTVRCVDITKYTHRAVPRSECTLQHSRNACDRVAHFVQENKAMLDRAHAVLLERQPPGGLVHVEQLLMHMYRKTAVLRNPNSLHKWLGIRQLDYEGRKQRTVERAKSRLSQFPEFYQIERQHDIADAWAYLEHYVQEQYEEQKKLMFRRRTVGPDLDSWFDSFKYTRRDEPRDTKEGGDAEP